MSSLAYSYNKTSQFFFIVCFLVCFELFLCSVVKGEILTPAIPAKRDFESIIRRINEGRENEKTKIFFSKSTALVSTARSDMQKLPQFSLNPVDLAIAGGLATAFGDFFMHPVDTIKTMQQASTSVISIPEACKRIFKESGALGFYAGVGPYVLGDGLAGAVKFATYEVSKGFVEDMVPEKWVPYSNFICAAGAMIASSVVMVPGELLKQQLQSGMATSLFDGMKSIFVKEGISGFYRGYGATMVRDIPYTMIELGMYDALKTMFMKLQGTEKSSQGNELLAAALTGGFAGFSTNPLDLIKTRMMTAKIGEAAPGFFRVGSDILKAEGATGLFKGAVARVSWLVPFTVIYLPLYETTKRTLLTLKMNKYKKTKQIAGVQ